jgi:hypothetical protein
MASETSLGRVIARVHRIIFHASREGRAAEIAAWSNAAASLLCGGGMWLLTRSWSSSMIMTGVTPVVVFVALRGALTSRRTVWIAATFGTLAVGVLGAALAWLFAHVLEVERAPEMAAVIGALLAGLAPAWAYSRIAERRRQNVRDSLLDPISSSS